MGELFDIGKKQLIISDQRIQLLDGIMDQVLLNPTQFRFGSRPIEMQPFTLGSKYLIEIKDDLDRKITLEWNSYLNFGKKKILDSYDGVLDKLWMYFFKERLKKYNQILDEGGVVTLGNYQLSREWIKKVNKEKNRERTISMDNTVVIRNWDQLIIKSKFDPELIFRIDTLNEWNFPFIYSLLDRLKSEG